jgi:hypothetical protein
MNQFDPIKFKEATAVFKLGAKKFESGMHRKRLGPMPNRTARAHVQT